MKAWRRDQPAVETGTRDYLKWAAVLCALVGTASAEYEIARSIGMMPWVAVAVPGALDAYVLRALRAHREVFTAVLAMVGVNAASHLVTAGVLKVDWMLITAVSAIAPLVLWRVHALSTPGEMRRAKLWGTGTPVPAAHGGEHDKAPDDPEPPGTREHPHIEKRTACVWGHAECSDANTCTVYRSAHIADGDLDVPDFMRPGTAEHTSVLDAPFPVHEHAPYDDHVSTAAPERARVLHAVADLPDTLLRRSTDTDTDMSTLTDKEKHAVLNAEHVRAGRLHEADVIYMFKARFIYAAHGPVVSLRKMKDESKTGTDRARRLVGAITHEHEEGHTP